nr:hypothetical protein [Tanacetum cinerariifolium]
MIRFCHYHVCLRGDGGGESRGGGVMLVGMVRLLMAAMVMEWLLILVVRGDNVFDRDGVVVMVDRGGGDDRRRHEIKYGTLRGSRRESEEAKSARRSERPQKGRHRDNIAVLDDKGIIAVLDGMSIISGRKSVPGMYSRKREKWKKDYSVFT